MFITFYKFYATDYITYPVDTYNEDGERTTEDIVCLVDVNVEIIQFYLFIILDSI